jgi:FkbM family methyltransferase
MESILPKEALNASVARVGAHALRLYFRNFPLNAGKIWVWNKVTRPYFGWRGIPIEARTRSGLSVRGPLSDTIHNSIFFFGVWEPALTKYIADSLVPGDVFIDIGANVGVHAMRASQCVGPSGKVHAIEASPTIYAMLQDNLRRNDLRNVVAHNLAASDRTGTVSVFLHDSSNFGGTTILNSAAGLTTQDRQETVSAHALPDIVPREDILRVRIIKIDVEGAEWPVLQGLAPLLPDLRPDVSIVVEVNRDALADYGISIAQFLEFFSERGYAVARIAEHSAASCIDGPRTVLLPVHADFEIADLVFRRVGAR